MGKRILIVSSNDELTSHVRKIAEELDIDFDLYEGGIMRDGHLYARNNSDNYDVIISSGGTAEAIRQIVNKPVISVEIRVADILNAIYEAKKYNKKIGMLVYKNDELAQFYKLKEYMNIDCEIFEYETKSELFYKQNEAVLNNLTLVGIGGCIKEAAKSNNLDYVIIKSSEKSVRDALINAVKYMRTFKNGQGKS